MDEDHVNRALCSENNKIPSSDRNHEHIAHPKTPTSQTKSAHPVSYTLSEHLMYTLQITDVVTSIEPLSNLHG
jgi:hypothetical protein